MSETKKRFDAEAFDGELSAIASRARGSLRRGRIHLALSRTVDQAVPLLFVVPGAWVVLQLARWSAGGEPSTVPGWQVFVATLAVPLGVVLARVFWAWSAHVTRRESLAAADARLGLDDRLSTADEFLASRERTAFMEAAVEDAVTVVDRARRGELDKPHVPLRFGLREKLVAGAAFALLAIALWLGTFGRALTAGPDEEVEIARGDLAALPSKAAPEEPERNTPPGPEADEPERTEREPRPAEESAGTRQQSNELPESTKVSEGETSSGRSSNAESNSGASESRGAPSNQAQATQAGEKKPPKESKKPEKKDRAKPKDRPKKVDEEESGATAGRGSSKGSNRNTAATDWSSKDQVTTPDDQEVEDDEDTEDEDEDQEARGGVQPHLRDRKPPVSRDLRIGFGNQKNPDANGRGGPSEPKKSRGTASLVLGVPIPDRVKGQPNPGKTKITQERIEPRAEEVPPVTAGARRARETPVGHLARPDLVPWMKDLVRAYFLEQRNETTQGS